MSARKTHIASAVTGTFQDRDTGETRQRRTIVGAMFTNERGEMSLKLDALPAGNHWDGWVNFFPPRDNES